MKTREKGAVRKGTRVLVRTPLSRDVDEFLELTRSSVSLHRGWAAPPADELQFDQYLERCQRPNFEGLLVCRTTDRRIVGVFNLSEIVRGSFQSAYMGYYAGARFARRGYMSEALTLVLTYAFTDLKLHRVEANVQPKNLPSIALVKRAGFTQEGYSRRYLKISGRWRDHERWALLAEDWKRRHEAV